MRFLRAITNRPWKIVTVSLMAAVFGYLGVLAINVIPAISHAQSFIHAVQSGDSENDITALGKSLTADMDAIFNDLNVPIVKQMVTLSGLNFAPIRDELGALINVGPNLAGANGPKKYLIAFQNSAEARGTGGIIGAFAIVEFNHGKLRVLQTGSNAMLKSLQEIPIPMPAEYKSLYRSDPAIW